MITKDSAKKACTLSRIKVSEEELNYFTSQVSMIMDMINEINDVDSDGVEPLISVHESLANPQKDEFNQSNTIDDLFSNTSGTTADLAKNIKCYVVPKVIE